MANGHDRLGEVYKNLCSEDGPFQIMDDGQTILRFDEIRVRQDALTGVFMFVFCWKGEETLSAAAGQCDFQAGQSIGMENLLGEVKGKIM